MQRLEVSGAVRTIYGSLGVKRLICPCCTQATVHDTDFLCWLYGETQCSETQPWSVQLGSQGRVLSGKHLSSRRLLSILILLGPCAMSMNNGAQHNRSKNSATSLRNLELLRDQYPFF